MSRVHPAPRKVTASVETVSVRHDGEMTVFQISYRGPMSRAVEAATALAAADGVELKSSERTERDDDAQTVVLVLTVEATTEAIADALTLVRDGLPSGAAVEIEDDP